MESIKKKESVEGHLPELETLLKKGSRFQMLIVAGLRYRQLNNGAHPKITLSVKTKNTRIAVEEVKQGLIIYSSIE